MRSTILCGVILAITVTSLAVGQVQPVQGSRAPSGGRTLVALSFAGTPVGDFPAGIDPNTGSLQVVDKNGQRMLRATTESSFLVTLPELMPQDFLLEFELIPKSGHGGYDFAIEGMKDVDQGAQSINLLWHSTNVRGVGGGGTGGFDAPMPDAVRVGLAGAPTTVVVAVTNQRIQFFANGTLTHTLPNRRFARSRILRVALGGENEDDGAVYLSSFRVAAMGTAANVATNQNAMIGGPGGGGGNTGSPGGPAPNTPIGAGGGSGAGSGNAPQPNGLANVTVTDTPAGPVVSWLGVNGAVYMVQRWLVADPACCANTSPASPALTSPPWQDTPLPVNGGYLYSVTATTSSGSTTVRVPFTYTSASGRAMPTTTSTSFPTPTTSTPTTTTVTVPASPGAIATPVQPASTGTSATTTTTAAPTVTAPTGAAATFPAPATTTSTQPPPGVASGSTTGVSGTSPTSPLSGSGAAPAGTTFPSAPTGNTTHSATPVSSNTSGKYRVTLTGARAYQRTLEVQTAPDGAGDEVYAAAAVVVWNRTTQSVQSQTTIKTLEYGEVPNATIYPNRIKVGTVTAYGGITGTEQVPAQFDPMGAIIPAPTPDRFPLLLWEGVLTDGVDAVLVVPSLWDRDLDPSLYRMWQNGWQVASMPQLFGKQELQNLLFQSTLLPTQLTVGPVQISLPPPELTASLKDHPIGMSPKPTGLPPVLADYEERFLMITREKLTQLQTVGSFVTLPVTYLEPSSAITRGSYHLYVRIERIP